MSNTLKHQFHKFDSGLRLVTIPMPATKTATVFVLVGTGSKYETKNINGISHFLEHMMFKGTTKRPGTMDIARELIQSVPIIKLLTAKNITVIKPKPVLKNWILLLMLSLIYFSIQNLMRKK